MKYSTLNPSLLSAHNSSILGSAWETIEASDLKGVKKKVGDNLVDKSKMPTHIFLPSEYNAADMRAELMKGKISDLVVTVVIKLPNTIRVESVYYSDLDERISELKVLSTGQAVVQLVYSEETSQIFWKDDIKTGIKPRMPDYGYVSKKHIRRAV